MVSCLSLNAQKNEVFQPDHDDLPYYLGISMGYGINNLNFQRNAFFTGTMADVANQLTASNSGNALLGLTGTLKLTDHFLLRANPMLLIGGSKSFKFHVNSDNDYISLPSNIISLPLALKMQSDRYNAFGYRAMMRHYVFVGGKADFDLSSTKEVLSDYKVLPYKALLNGNDFGYEFGLGLSFYLRYVTISPEIKFSYGLTNLKNSTPTEHLLDHVNKVNANFVYFTIQIEN